MGDSTDSAASRTPGRFLHRLATLVVIAGVLVGSIGPLGAAPASATDDQQDRADKGEAAYPHGRVIGTTPSLITVPSSGAGPDADASVGGPPLFLPYTPPADTVELADQRTGQSRTLANPDGTYTTEVSDGPINFKDAVGAWQPIDLALVERPFFDGYEVAATTGDIKIGTADGALGSIELNGHAVSLTPSTYVVGVKGEGSDANRVDFPDFSGATASLWVRPVDIGLEFGATWSDSGAPPLVTLHLDSGDLTAALGKDEHSIIFTNEKGEFAGRIDFPILREGSEDGPPILDQVTVTLDPEPSGGYVLTYAIDAKWLEAPERVFPVILDPTWCIGEGATGCDDNTTSPDSFDTFVYDSNPDGYEIGWTVLRTGYDVRSDDAGTYGKMRSILYFPQVALPDGAVIYDTDLQARIYSLYGAAQGETITANRLTKKLSTQYTWTKFGSAFDATGAASDVVPASGYMNWDVDDIVTSFYTRRSKLYKAPYGFLLKMSAEGSTHGEVEYRRYNYGTAAYRPLLTISYTLPKVGIDFDPRLGPTYAPSKMVAGQSAKLPVLVENKTGSAATLDKCVVNDTDCWKVGYRWFDGKGNLVGGGTSGATVDLLADVAVGTESTTPVVLDVTPPSTTGQYTLALELVHFRTGHYWWSSDFASPSLYYSRNKKILTSSSTRWTGSSAIERDEFSIDVTEGVGGLNTQSVSVGSGGSVGIDLSTKNLSVGADTGLGFADRSPLSLTYGYNEALGELCAGYQGLLGACGWYTNWDERVIGGANQTGFDYSYVDPGGTPAMLDTDDSGQIAGGASVLFNRQRVTILDENGGWDSPGGDGLPDIPGKLASAESPSITAWSGQYVAKSNAGADVLVNAPDKVSLNVYRRVRFAMRTTTAVKAGMCFQIHNLTDSANFPDRWYCYTLGDASWSAGNDYRSFSSLTLTTAWMYIDEDLYNDVRNDGDYGDTKDDYQVIGIRVEGAAGMSGGTYVDAFRFESDETPILGETNLSNWTTGQSQTASSSDAKVGTSSIKVTPGSGIAPACQTSNSCWTTGAGGTWAYPFFDWYWKKAGGTSAAMVFYLHDERSGAHCNTGSDCTLTYYAGASPTFTATGAYNASIRIAANLPTTWTQVRRNVAADAAQALNLFDDGGTGAADDIRITGWAPVAVDGNNLLIDQFSYGNLADTGAVDPTGPYSLSPLVLGEKTHPTAAGDTTFTYDFSADYADGSRHYFNRKACLLGFAAVTSKPLSSTGPTT